MSRRILSTLAIALIAGLAPAQQGDPATRDALRALQADYPAQPMALPAMPYRGTILVLQETPSVGDGHTAEIARWVALHLDMNARSGISVIEAKALDEYVDFASGNDDSPGDLSAEERARLVAYVAPTIQVGLAVRREGGELVADCRLVTPKGIESKEFRAPGDADLSLARQVAVWASGSGAIEFSKEEGETYALPLFGSLGESTRDAKLAGLLDGDLAAVDAALAAEPENIAVRYFASRAALRARKAADYAKTMLTRPLDLQARSSAYRHITQANLLEGMGANGPAMRERLVAVAAYPVNEPLYAASIKRLPPARLDDNFIMEVAPWRGRLGKRPIDDARGANLMHKAALHHMPADGFAAADPEARDAMAYYARAAEDHVQAGLKNAGPVPALVALAMADMMMQERRDAIPSLFESSLKDYAASRKLWRERLALEQPSMGGSLDAANELVERALNLAEQVPVLGLVACDQFALRVLAEGGEFAQAAAKLRQSDPAAWDRVMRGIGLSMKGAPSPDRLAEVAQFLASAGDLPAIAPLAAACSAETRARATELLRKQGDSAAADAVAAAGS